MSVVGDVNTLTVLAARLATKRLPWASKARALGSLTPVRVRMGVVPSGANTLTVLASMLATKRLPWASKARAMGVTETGEGGGGVAVRIKLAHRVGPELATKRLPSVSKARSVGRCQPAEGGDGCGAARQELPLAS